MKDAKPEQGGDGSLEKDSSKSKDDSDEPTTETTKQVVAKKRRFEGEKEVDNTPQSWSKVSSSQRYRHVSIRGQSIWHTSVVHDLKAMVLESIGLVGYGTWQCSRIAKNGIDRIWGDYQTLVQVYILHSSHKTSTNQHPRLIGLINSATIPNRRTTPTLGMHMVCSKGWKFGMPNFFSCGHALSQIYTLE